MTLEERARDQYADDAKLNARINLHRRFSSSPVSWSRWVFDQMRLPGNASVLELGGGTGLLWTDNRDRLLEGLRLVFSDPSTGMLDSAKTNLAGIPGVEFRQAEAAQIPDDRGAFDVVIANHMLYEVPDRFATLSEVVRVLRPDGRFYAATNGANHMRELDELIGPAVKALETSTTRFSLENGKEQLAGFFRSIKLVRHDNWLAVTDAAAVIAYVRSLSLDLSERDYDRIARAVDGVIKREGVFWITRDSGIFVCAEPRLN